MMGMMENVRNMGDALAKIAVAGKDAHSEEEGCILTCRKLDELAPQLGMAFKAYWALCSEVCEANGMPTNFGG